MLKGKGSIYLNNAATSWPKPEPVIEKLIWATREFSSSPGRSGYSALEGERAIFEAREQAAGFIGAEDSSRIIFTHNATAALNLAITGFLKKGAQVVTTSLDHNSVLRPLTRAADEINAQILRVKADARGILSADAVVDAVTAGTSLVVLTHASNVAGSIQPVERICSDLRSKPGVSPAVLVDAAQSAGVLPLEVRDEGPHMIAVPGHKSLYGPQGTGFLYIAPGIELDPVVEGGTGGQSTLTRQPEILPERYESGTPNTPGIAALGEALRYIRAKGIQVIRAHEMRLMEILLDGLSSIPGVSIWGPCSPADQVAVLSFTVDDLDPAEVGSYLEQTRNIQVRVGLHCSPESHRTIGTFPEGTVRVSPGLFNTEADVLSLSDGVRELQRVRGLL